MFMCPSLGRCVNSNTTYKDKTWGSTGGPSQSAIIDNLINREFCQHNFKLWIPSLIGFPKVN